MEQLCWKCCKCTNSNLCTWVKCFMYPEGVKLDGDDNIVYCPSFQPRQVLNKGNILDLLGVSERTYYRYKSECDTLYLRYKNVKFLPKMSELCLFFNKNPQKILENYDFFVKEYLTKYEKSV